MIYETTDFSLATVLYTLGIKFVGMESAGGSRKTFLFEETKDLQKIIDQYWSRDLTVEPQELFNSMRVLKTRLYS